jgi:hypothetical protein
MEALGAELKRAREEAQQAASELRARQASADRLKRKFNVLAARAGQSGAGGSANIDEERLQVRRQAQSLGVRNARCDWDARHFVDPPTHRRPRPSEALAAWQVLGH